MTDSTDLARGTINAGAELSAQLTHRTRRHAACRTHHVASPADRGRSAAVPRGGRRSHAAAGQRVHRAGTAQGGTEAMTEPTIMTTA